jgi:U2-associated protein SR140
MSRDQDDDIDAQKEKEDPSHAKLVALYIISDILNGCATAGVKNAWKYKPLIESAFKEHKVFGRLGRLEKEMDWGKIKAERWRNAVTNLLNIWEGWSVFSVGTPKEFIEVFTNPPPTEDERERIEKEEKEREARREKAAKFKAAKKEHSEELDGEPMEEDDLDGAPMDDEDIDGQPMEEDDLDGQLMDEEDITGQPMEEKDDIDGAPMEEEADIETPSRQDVGQLSSPPLVVEMDKKPGGGFSFNPTKSVISRGANRPKAVDMFAESDEE